MSEPIVPRLNYLLGSLSEDAQTRLFPYLRQVRLPAGQVLYHSDRPLREVYFPIDSIVSLLHETDSGWSAEFATVGSEGFVGLDVLLGGGIVVGRGVVQSEGHAFSLSTLRLRTEFNSNHILRMNLLHYVQSLFRIVAQTAICNRHHSIEQQLCRWLLLAVDRLPDNQVKVTQQLIADRLGVRREGVTHAACRLQKLGAIRCKRGRIKVLERSELKKLSCECYAVAAGEYESLRYPQPPGNPGNSMNGSSLGDMLCAPSHRRIAG